MNNIYQQLRKAREAKGLELKEIEEVTKIRSRYLQALEEGDYCVLPGGVYTVGFLRSYARYLELDAESLVNTFRLEVTAAELESTINNTTKNKRQQVPSFIDIIVQLYREAGGIFKIFKTNRLER